MIDVKKNDSEPKRILIKSVSKIPLAILPSIFLPHSSASWALLTGCADMMISSYSN